MLLGTFNEERTNISTQKNSKTLQPLDIIPCKCIVMYLPFPKYDEKNMSDMVKNV